MGSKIEYVDSTQIYATSYARNSKAIGVLWAIFTICYGIIVVVSFITPEWIGVVEGENAGKIGLWSVCRAEEQGEMCKGKFYSFYELSNIAFVGASACVGIAVLTALLTICMMVLFLFCHSTTVYHICGWLQVFSALALIGGCAGFPAGWAEEDVRKICLTSYMYNLGTCSFRWAYLLAAIGCL
ncbi:LHFPL tetraspan subfamily member 3 protein, partial [Agrilus planipennis]|uniref:LHFPL tetraspan subfamily member 3 protein n=1 Tax=Agrilus planipennis TaxID=224129 RepID=A0A1W4WG20_AGRPL